MAKPFSVPTGPGSKESGRKPHMKSKPDSEGLLSELDSVVDWKLLIVKMGVEKNEIDRIKKNNPEDIDQQKKEAFEKWLAQTPNACWKDIIDALFEIEENSLAGSLTTKYPWKGPRVNITANFLSVVDQCRLTAEQVIPFMIKQFLPPLDGGLQYYTFRAESAESLNWRLAATQVADLKTRIMEFGPYTLMNQIKRIEEGIWKNDCSAGLGARFGKMYWKFDEVLPPKSMKETWTDSELMRKPRANFIRGVESADMEQLFRGRKKLGNDVYTKLKLAFTVEGQDDGDYVAIISTYDSEEVFHLDCVYRMHKENTTKLSVGLPGRKYDFRIFEFFECNLLEHENSMPYKIAKSISEEACKLPERKLRIKLHGNCRTAKSESTWRIDFIRQEIQRQYQWRPDKKWILNRYDINVFDSVRNQVVRIDQIPPNEPVDIDILHFNFSQEVELWGRRIYPKDVNKTNPSREKYYYIEGINGVQLPGGEVRPPCDWTAEELLSDFEEFLGEALKIAHILDGSL